MSMLTLHFSAAGKKGAAAVAGAKGVKKGFAAAKAAGKKAGAAGAKAAVKKGVVKVGGGIGR